MSQTIGTLVAYLENALAFDTLPAEEELLMVMPDEDTDPDLASAVAEDAIAAAVYTLRVIQNSDPQDAIWAARRAYDSADRQVMATLNVGTVGDAEEQYILQHPMVQTELQRQVRDLEAVSEVSIEMQDKLLSIVARAHSENIFLHRG